MLPPRYRRLFSVAIRRRPLLPFLLAAFVAVDGVLMALPHNASGPLGSGFLVAQLGLLALWITLPAQGVVARLFVALLTTLPFAFGILWQLGETAALRAALGLGSLRHSPFLGNTVGILAILLLLKVIVVIVVRLLFDARWRRWHASRRVRYSIGTLLGLMLLVSLFGMIFRGMDWQLLNDRRVWTHLLAEMIPPSIVLILALLSRHGWRRWALLGGIPLLVTLFSWLLVVRGGADPIDLHYPLQVLVMGLALLALDTRCRSTRKRLPNAPVAE